jgi:predicted nucleic acid-binding protein
VIVDTNALSAWADGDRMFEPLLRSSASIIVPVVARAYGVVRLELNKSGTLIPINDIWIAATALHRRRPIISRDGHFEVVSGIERVPW